ncbi:guanylate kinase [Xylariales sp. PMI_506]|nr:guanylate kinase [Xylariales sp. PMI_506]
MLPLDSEVLEIPEVLAFSAALGEALDRAKTIKPVSSIEPALTKSDFEPLFSQLPSIFPTPSASDQEQASDIVETRKARQYTAIETAVRRRFDTLLASTPITAPEFVEVWNILDVLAALSDSEQCDPTLLFSLVEELIDSQTIEGCRVTFDYLESRRERITAKHWKPKGLIVLRTCNELLRRLSRAEDITFSGRVFIFMFQSFPMGDKGTVNLRGAYHTENVTTYEDIPSKSEESTEKMEIDAKEEVKEDIGAKPTSIGVKAVSFDAKDKTTSEKPLDTDALYPIFWSLQQYFCQPTKLFDAENMSKFKSALEATVIAFGSVAQGQRSSKSMDDTKDSSKKRKRLELDASDSGTFNPKYLTSRDLFELEMSDLFFRRHILIQAIIVLDFLRSLTPTAKAKHTHIQQPNRSVMYGDKSISEEDDKWAETTRNRIYDYIFAGPDGQYVHRIIQAVTQRDKGWTRWKMETCPPIERPAVTPSEFIDARASAKRMATGKKLRPHPMGSLSLNFLKEEDDEAAMKNFKDPARWKLPDLATFKDKITEDDLEIDFAKSDKEKAQILEAKASKTWRALRIASRSRLAAFDRIDDWQNVQPIFEDPKDPKEEDDAEGETGPRPDDNRAIIITGPPGVGKTTLVSMLLDRHPRIFQKLPQHTNRPPREGEVNGEDYNFVDKATFNMMLDGDQLLEFVTKDDFDYGTNRRTADYIQDSGKIPIMLFDRESVQSSKDFEYPARVVFLSPPNIEELEARLKKSSRHSEESIKAVIETAAEEIEQAKTGEGFYDTVIINDDVETAYKLLEHFIYGGEPEGSNGINGANAEEKGENDAKMEGVETIGDGETAAE